MWSKEEHENKLCELFLSFHQPLNKGGNQLFLEITKNYEKLLDKMRVCMPIERTCCYRCYPSIGNFEAWADAYHNRIFTGNNLYEAIGRCVYEYTLNYGPIMWSFADYTESK